MNYLLVLFSRIKVQTRRQRESDGLVPWRAKNAMTNVIVYMPPVKRKKRHKLEEWQESEGSLLNLSILLVQSRFMSIIILIIIIAVASK